MTGLGVYVGNDPSQLLAFEVWLGRSTDGVQGFVGGASWADFTGSAKWAVSQLWSQVGQQVYWSVPLIVADGTASLAMAADGGYDAYYRSVALSLATAHAGDDGKIIIRTGWEFNGDWFPWSAAGREADYIGAYRNFVDVFRSVSDRFAFEWNVNEAWGGMDPASAYPGDAYVDIISMDFYWDTQWNSVDPKVAWDSMVNRPYGLAWLEAFAAAHGKPTAYPEWGLMTDNAAPYLEQVKAWFDSHNVVYQSYWNSNAAFPGLLSDNSMPDAAAAYRSLFGPVDPVAAAAAAAPQGGMPGHYIWGTAAAEHWTGTADNDQIFSGGGGDTMDGGASDDTYLIFDASDRIIEAPGGGIDTVKTWLGSYALPANVENLVLTGTGWSTLLGNQLANRIIGNDSPNTIAGGAGNDVLTGGGGTDNFIIRKTPGDVIITDFQGHAVAGVSADHLSFVGFGAGATLSHTADAWTITSSDGGLKHVQLQNVTSISTTDYAWG